MNSFYGGQSGRTYHIVKRYKSISQMLEAFALGGSYVQVNYGEYVLISTLNKNSPENGLLFRRSFDYDDETGSQGVLPDPEAIDEHNNKIYYTTQTVEGSEVTYFDQNKYQPALDECFSHVGHGAIYVGRIVGADGKTPNIGLLKWEDPITGEARQDSYSSLASDSDADGYEGRVNNQPIYNDTIQVATFSILDENGNVEEVKLALKIPKPTFIVSAQSVDAYGDIPRTHINEATGHTDSYQAADPQQEQEEQNANLKITVIRDSDDKIIGYSNLIRQHSQTGKEAGHPFYHNYDIAIPKGIKGQQITHILTETAVETELNPEHFYPNFIPNSQDETNIDSQGNNIVIGDEYITFDITNYDANADGDTFSHQGRLPFRVIKEIIPNLRENRLYIPTLNNENHLYEPAPQVGALYQISENNHIYAICTKAGTFGEHDLDNLQPGGAVENENRAWWRCIQIEAVSPESLTIDYKAGPSDENIPTGFLDYLYLDYQGNLFAKYANGQTSNLGFIDRISNITHNDGKFTITFISNKSQEFYVNSIVDVQRIGDQLYFLYADDNFRKTYYREHSNNCRLLPYSGLNPQSRFNNSEVTSYDVNDEFIYIRLDSSIGGGYHIQGEFNFEDVLWIASNIDPLHSIKYIGKIADIDKELFNFNAQSEGQSSSQVFDFDDIELNKAIYDDQLKNIYKQGYIVNILTPINSSENTVEFYAYNFNHPQNNITTILDRVKIREYFENCQSNIRQADQQHYSQNERYILLDKLINDYIDKRNNITQEYEFNIYSNWYALQQVNEASINIKRVYIIDEIDQENPNMPKHYLDDDFILNDNGLWFVTSFGHDE